MPSHIHAEVLLNVFQSITQQKPVLWGGRIIGFNQYHQGPFQGNFQFPVRIRSISVGDLVAWDSWAESLDTGVFEEKNGLLLSIFKDERTHGWGYMAKIMCFGEDREVILPLITVRKSTLRN